jgi:hypothetical protein
MLPSERPVMRTLRLEDLAMICWYRYLVDLVRDKRTVLGFTYIEKIEERYLEVTVTTHRL